MRKNFKGEAKKARRVSIYTACYGQVTDSSILRKIQRTPFVSRYWDKRYYAEKQQAKENSFWAAQKETEPAHLQEQIDGFSKAIKAKEKAIKALMKDIEELSSKKEDLLFIMRNL